MSYSLSPLKPLVHDAQKYDALMAYIDNKIERELKVLEDLIEPAQIYKSQGKIKAFRAMKNIRKEVMEGDK